MPLPRRKRDRWHQVLAWLNHVHPAPRPVRLRVERLGPNDAGECERRPREFLIRIDPRQGWTEGLDTLLHEYAHALSWPAPRVERHHPDHSDEWALVYGRLYRHFFEEGGSEGGSRDYLWR